ncbi:MAG: DUF2911 domain-containing protein [Bacteroidota bacterium]
MKRTILTILASAALMIAAQAQIDTPQPSPAGSVSSRIGLTDLKVEYYRPKMKGRKIFGAGSDFLIPFGQIWRTGANAGTVVSFPDEISFGGEKVAAGQYLLFTKPGASNWDVMLYNDITIGGNVAAYKTENEVVKVTVPSAKLTEKVETFTINIAHISEDNKTAHLQIAWENTAVNIPIEVDFDKKVLESIAVNTKVNPNNLLAAANYYYSTNRELDKALEWVNTYLAVDNNGRQFWNVHLKAQILAKMGDKKGAIETATKSLEMAKANKNGDFGYIARNEALIASVKGK